MEENTCFNLSALPGIHFPLSASHIAPYVVHICLTNPDPHSLSHAADWFSLGADSAGEQPRFHLGRVEDVYMSSSVGNRSSTQPLSALRTQSVSSVFNIWRFRDRARDARSSIEWKSVRYTPAVCEAHRCSDVGLTSL